MDFKWEMQMRIDEGMNPDQAYETTRDSYTSIWDNMMDELQAEEVCNCTCDVDCECKNPRVDVSDILGDGPFPMGLK